MVTLTHKTGISREPLQGTSYQVRLSEGGQDSEWDAYVASRPGGHHTQSSLWGAVKSAGGWRAVHLVVKDRGRVVAGGQLLTRPFKFGLRVGYVANGPLYPTGNPALGALVLDELLAACRSQRVGFLVIQPPQNGEPVTEQLIGRGFGPSWFELAPIATVLIDLVPDSAEMLACMKRQTRQNIRRSEERGVVVAEGEESDLPVFHRLYAATSERHGTHPYSLQYFQTMWRILEPFGMLKLFVAAIEGEPVSRSSLFRSAIPWWQANSAGRACTETAGRVRRFFGPRSGGRRLPGTGSLILTESTSKAPRPCWQDGLCPSICQTRILA